MSDNSLSSGGTGDSIRTVNKSVNSATKTQMMILDVGGGIDASPETPLAVGQTVMASSLPVVIASNQTPIGIATGGTSVVAGQARLSVAGTAQQLPTNTLLNGLTVTANISNGGTITIGGPSVTNTINGTGNGIRLAPGQSYAYSISNSNALWFNGTVTGDSLDFGGN